MSIPVKDLAVPEVSCSNCQACCCRLEVMLITDTGVPERHIARDKWGAETMRRLADGWCSAVDRETFMCTIYENRPWICREFEMGSDECLDERAEGLESGRYEVRQRDSLTRLASSDYDEDKK